MYKRLVAITAFFLLLVPAVALARPVDTVIPDTYEPTSFEASSKVRSSVRVPVPGHADQWIELPYMRAESFTYRYSNSVPGTMSTTKKYALYYVVESITNNRHICNNAAHNKDAHTYEYTGPGAASTFQGFVSTDAVLGACYRSIFFASTVNGNDVSIPFRLGGIWSQIYQPVWSPTLNKGADMYIASAFIDGNLLSWTLQPKRPSGWNWLNGLYNGPHDCVTCSCPAGAYPEVSRIIYGLESDSALSEVASVHSSLSSNATWSNDYDPLNGGEYTPPITPDSPKFDDLDPWVSGEASAVTPPSLGAEVDGLLGSVVEPIKAALQAVTAPLSNMFSMFDEWQQLGQ